MSKVLIITTTSGFLSQFELNNVKLLQERGYQVHYATNFGVPVYEVKDGSLFRHVMYDLYGKSLKGKVQPGKDISRTNNSACNNKDIVHIGDNPHSDHKMAKVCGLDIMPYQNVNKSVLL